MGGDKSACKISVKEVNFQPDDIFDQLSKMQLFSIERMVMLRTVLNEANFWHSYQKRISISCNRF